MALAPYFDKAALAAATVLQGFDRARFAEILESVEVALCVDSAAIRSREGLITIDLAANLLARLYPSIALVFLDSKSKQIEKDLGTLMRRVNPSIRVKSCTDITTLGTVAAAIVVGATRIVPPSATFYLGSDGWLATLKSDTPASSGSSTIPFGAAAAACFGVANVFRVIFREQLPASEPDRSLSFCTLHHISHDVGCGNNLPAVDFGETILAGVGAIGNAFVWTLSHLSPSRGSLHILDGESVELSNVQRYVLTDLESVGVSKVTVANRAWNTAGLLPRAAERATLHEHQCTWGSFLNSTKSPWQLQRVALALDSARDRCAAQAALPASIHNSWTQEGDLGISRHVFGETACVMCLYVPTEKSLNEDQLVAEAIGLPQRLMDVRILLHSNAPIGEVFLRDIAAALGFDPAELMRFSIQPLRAFYSEALCGGLVMRLQGSPHARVTHVPMAFQSALAGVLLAASVTADAAGLPLPTTTKTVIDLLRPLGQDVLVPVARDATTRCICKDPDFIDAFARRFGLVEQPRA